MAHFSKRNRRRERETQEALNNRLELVKEGFTRRDLMKIGLMSSAGVLLPKVGLTHASVAPPYGSDCDLGNSPQPAQVFVDPMPIPPELPARPLTDPGLTFGAPPQICPNNVPNPANNNLPYEGRGQFNGLVRPGSDCFQFFNQYPPQKYFVQRIRANNNFRICSDTNIPAQKIWGFNLGGTDPLDVGTFPGPTLVSRYQEPWLVRRFNELPTQSQNGTINHYAGLRIAADRILLDVVIDQAEIPTFQERQRIDANGDGQLSDDELAAERLAACPRVGGIARSGRGQGPALARRPSPPG